MKAGYPSIFNDVIGPIMRGPSSSHCAASLRIGRMARDLMDGEIEAVAIEFDPNGSLAATHASQGADMGLFAGLLGWQASDERLIDSAKAIRAADIKIRIEISDFRAPHPNTYKLTLTNRDEIHEVIAISTGGGMIEVIEIDGVSLSIRGDYFETLISIESNEEAILRYLATCARADVIHLRKGRSCTFIEIKAQNFLNDQIYSELQSKGNVIWIKKLSPVLPVLSRIGLKIPFISCREMMNYNEGRNLALWELGAYYESVRANISVEEVFKKMLPIVRLMQSSIHAGIKGTERKDRILGYQSGFFQSQLDNHHLLDAGILNRMILYATAMMEVKSAMGIIVAAPTAGACGCLPGACIGAAHGMGLTDDEMVKGLLAAGMIGVLIATHATFAAEIGGCQAECGAASGMAAAALVTLRKGTSKQAVGAASMALQNIFGMVCDPVANRVEVPCLGKNILAVSNALSCANIALADFDPVIPLDEVIEAMDTVGKNIPYELRCTALGGLSVTKTSKEIEKRLDMTHSLNKTQ